MTALVLRLAAPLQSWGTSSRFVRRNTDRVPSKSGVLGLLAAAQGRRRTDPLEDLLELRLGVRVEHLGRVERDFQTAQGMPLSYRQYLADAAFLAVVDGREDLLSGLADALERPAFPLYLGRRSCPPVGRLSQGLRSATVETLLAQEAWLAPHWVQRSTRTAVVRLSVVTDCAPGDPGSDLVRDEPLSFDPERRQYGWRSVRHSTVDVPNPEFVRRSSTRSPAQYDFLAPLDERCS